MKKPSVKQSMKCQVCSKLADLPPVEASSGQELQFQISIVKAHIGTSTGRSTWQIYPPNLKLSSVADDVLADLCHFTESPFETVGRSTTVFYSESPYKQINWQ